MEITELIEIPNSQLSSLFTQPPILLDLYIETYEDITIVVLPLKYINNGTYIKMFSHKNQDELAFFCIIPDGHIWNKKTIHYIHLNFLLESFHLNFSFFAHEINKNMPFIYNNKWCVGIDTSEYFVGNEKMETFSLEQTLEEARRLTMQIKSYSKIEF